MMKLFCLNTIVVFINLLPIIQCQIAAPRIDDIQRIRLNAVRIKWSVPNELAYKLTKNRVLLFDNVSSKELPSQAQRVSTDGSDVQTLETLFDKTYLQCIDACLETAQCRFIVKSGNRCYLKSETPVSGTCALFDECATVFAYSNEANLYDLPMNTSFRLQVQVYDSKSKLWSAPSQLSGLFRTDYIMPQIINPVETTIDGVRIKWNVADQIVKPIRYRIAIQRKLVNDEREWPDQMQLSSFDGGSDEIEKLPSTATSSNDCRNLCIRNAKCFLAVKDNLFCYLKALPSVAGICANRNGCWVLKEYQSFAELASLPYDETYKFRVSFYDEYSRTWSSMSDYSEEYSSKINLIIDSEKLDEYTYKVRFRQERFNYPLVRMRIQVSKNGAPFAYDTKTDNNLRRFFIQSFETVFSNFDAVNQGSLDEARCLQTCYEDIKCVGIKISNGNCYTTGIFDPFIGEPCLPTERCYSVTNTANETMFENLDPSSNFRMRLEYLTKYNTRGFSNIIELNTTGLSVNITSTELKEYQRGTLKCTTFNDSLISGVAWIKDDVLIETNNRLNATINNEAKTLTFANLSRTIHNGQYRCIVQLSTTEQILNSTTFHLMVKFGPIFTDKYVNQSKFTFNVSRSARFDCEAEGFGMAYFGWKYNNDIARGLDTYSNYSNQTYRYYSSLNFNNLTRRDNGSYSCFIDSSIISTVQLFVPSTPSKPRILNITSVDRANVFLNWVLDDEGDYPIEKVLIEAQNANGNTEYFERDVRVTRNGTILTLELQNEAIVRIRLKNALGYGALSEPVKFSIAQIPAPAGLSTLELVIAIVVPVLVLLLISIILVVYYRRRCSKTTRI